MRAALLPLRSLLIGLTILLAMAARPASAGYIVTTIAVPGALGTIGTAIDGAGRVIGSAFVVDGNGRLTTQGFIWQNGTATLFGIAGSDTSPTAVSNNGLIVGTATDAGGGVTGFLYDGVSFTTTGAYPSAVNDSGQIVGRYFVGADLQAFLSDGTTLTNIDVPGGTNTGPTSINAAGAIVGQFQQADGSYAGFSRVGGIVAPFSIPDATATSLIAVNDNIQVIATSVRPDATTADGTTQDAYLIDRLGVTPLLVPGGTMVTPLAINNRGMIVGTYRDINGDSRGFLDDNGVYTTIDVPGSLYTVAYAINGNGQIAGLTVDTNGAPLAFFAQADVNEPASWAALSLPLILAGCVRSRANRRRSQPHTTDGTPNPK